VIWQESFSSCAIEGNMLAEICSGTLSRLINHKPVSDRYLLGLAFTILKNNYNKLQEIAGDLTDPTNQGRSACDTSGG